MHNHLKRPVIATPHASLLCVTAGLVMLGDDMAASLIDGLPESVLLAASRA